MPRIQVMNLPDEMVDGKLHNRFVLVLDEHPNVVGADGKKIGKKFDRFARSVGAAGGIVCNERIDIAESGGDPLLVEFDTAVLSESFAAALRAHLESPEASDAVRAYYERGAARARSERQDGQTVEHHFHFNGATLDHERLTAIMQGRDKRQRGDI